MTEQPTAADRLPQHMESRSQTIAGLFDLQGRHAEAGDYCPYPEAGCDGCAPLADFEAHDIDPDDPYADDAVMEALDGLALAVDQIHTARITLSTGGPADGLDVDYDADGVTAVRYWFADWFDHSERTVDPESSTGRALWLYAERMTEHLSDDLRSSGFDAR